MKPSVVLSLMLVFNSLGAFSMSSMPPLFSEMSANIDMSRAQMGSLMGVAWLDWARQNVHRHASLFTSDELMERATGRPVEITPLMSHFRERYLST